ncbi:dicarboxylate/amino acid:cation symporter [Sphingosinicella sp.]|uniref:dicarboxylate/amino acid:cation symporter n=1 Tax=Sphingosinicella sp. TaxID=1917971 RepID=UPI0040381C80
MAETERRGMSLQMKMLVGFLVGLVFGLIVHSTQANAPWVAWVTSNVTGPIGRIFLNLLFMLVIPLIFSALVVGIAEMGDVRSLKRVGLKTLGYTVLLSSIAVLLALAAANILQPGAGVERGRAEALIAQGGERASQIVATAREQQGIIDTLVAIIPSNVVDAAADNNILAVMFFALVFGIGLLLVNTPAANRLQDAIQGILDVTMRLIGIVIRMAPIAIFCFMFGLAATFGWELLVRLAAYVGVVLLVLGVHMFVSYPLALKFLGGKSPLQFFRDVQEAMVVAFSTASSNATLPTSLRVAEEKLKLPPRVSRFVLTIGATANQNGTAIFEGITVLFLAQFFGIHLDLWAQVTVLLICILAGIGTAGVPAGSLPVIAIILASVGVPAEGIGLILGVDRLLDMCRTTLNVTGDLAIATIVSRDEEDAVAAPAATGDAAAAEAHPS